MSIQESIYNDFCELKFKVGISIENLEFDECKRLNDDNALM